MRDLFRVAISILFLVLVSSCCGGGKGMEKYQCKSKQAEAMAGLMSAATAMEAARVESDKYPETIEDLEKTGWTTQKKFYTYSIAASGPSSFIIEAIGTGDMEGDVVRIDQERKIEPITDKCK